MGTTRFVRRLRRLARGTVMSGAICFVMDIRVRFVMLVYILKVKRGSMSGMIV